ncbi:putative Ig domain-containing protein [Glycomyces sp. A-F 0318]|uniref:putative Ig domain-containing protein n=1 Tax=Glycomyces amatae TaxID=2881355 RepID=UPI001E3C2254|nr:putative Ig domain-containing protein [Glycomyces amatae]MCD0442441.1 putative Ig domain-containing protein [Glycomyces amatae]
MTQVGQRKRSRLVALAAALATGLGAAALPPQAAGAAEYDDLITDHLVAVNETVSDAGFVHPGVGLTAEDLRSAQEMVRTGQEPWASYFAAMADTAFASTAYRASNSKSAAEPDVPLDPTFTQAGMRNRETNDSFGALTQSLMWVTTGDEVYRRNAIQAIRTWSNMDPERYAYFPDAHIHTGHPLYQFLMAAEIIRATEPVDDDSPGEHGGYDVAWSAEDDRKLLANFADPVVETFLFSNERWMNQHNFGLFGRIATAIYADDAEGYATGVEWFTVNSGDTAYDNGAMAPQMPLIDADDPANPYGRDFVQVREMGRDQAHGECNIDNFTGLARMLEVQGTKVDPTAGTVSTGTDAVSAYDFLDQRLLDGANAFWGFMMGAPTPWIDEEGQGNTIAQAYRGRIFNPVNELYYEYALERGVDVAAEAPHVAELASRMDGPYYWYGTGVANFWAPGDKNPEYWVAFPAELAGTAPEPLPDTAALSFADASLPLDDRTAITEEDGETFARANVTEEGTTSVVSRMMYGSNAQIGLRFRSDGPAGLEVLYKEEATGVNPDEAETRTLAALEIPDTGGEWRYLAYPAGGQNVNFYRLTGEDGTTVDLDSVILSGATDLSVPRFNSTEDHYYLTKGLGASIDLSAKDTDGTVTYRVDGLPERASFDTATGGLAWTPNGRDKGRHDVQIVADDGTAVTARTVQLVVSPNPNRTVETVVRDGVDRRADYTAATRDPYEEALEEARDAARHGSDEEFAAALDALIAAIDALELLDPELPDESFDYTNAVAPFGITDNAVVALADGDNTSHTGDLRTGSFTLDFGTRYRITADAFGFQARSLFANRSEGTNVYGSNDGIAWDLLTERATANDPDMETIEVLAEHDDDAYRYLKVQLDEPGVPTDPAYPGIWSIGEFRIFGERSEAPGDIDSVSVSSPDALAGRVTAGDTVTVDFSSAAPIGDVAVSIGDQALEATSEDGLAWTATAELGELTGSGPLDVRIDHTTEDGDQATVHGSTDGTVLYGSDERDLIDLADVRVVASDGSPDASKAAHAAKLLDADPATFSDVPAVDGEFHLIWDFGEGAEATVDRADFLARQDNNGLVRMDGLVLEGSNDLSTWTALTAPTVKTLAWQELPSHDEGSYRYVRVANGALIDIAELRLFGAVAGL